MLTFLMLFLFPAGYSDLYVLHSFRMKRYSQAVSVLVLSLLLKAVLAVTAYRYWLMP